MTTEKLEITLEPTDKIIAIKAGTKARIWEGRTKDGKPLFAVIAEVAVHKDADGSAFERALIEAPKKPPTDGGPWPLRYFMD